MQIFYPKNMKYKAKGFTLSEVLVVIAVIGILWVAVSNLNFSRISQQELLAIESIKMLATTEEMRNNALVGKAVDINGQIPESWYIEFNIPSNNYSTSYSGGTLQTQELRNPFEILSITCSSLEGNMTAKWSSIKVDFFTNTTTSVSWCPTSVFYPKILEIEIGRWDIRSTIRINTLTNVIEEI